MAAQSSNQVRVLELVRRLHPFARPLRIAVDSASWIASIAIVTFVRFNLSFDGGSGSRLWRAVPLLLVIQVLAGYAVGLYRRRWRYGSFDEVAALAATAAITTTALYFLNKTYLTPRAVPQSAVLAGGAFGLLLMAASRYMWRLVIERIRRPTDRTAERLLIFGAGEGGIQVITGLVRSPSSPYVPVGLLDDDSGKQRLSISGVSVLGTRDDMQRARAKTDATSLLIAIPSASSKVIGEIADLAGEAGLGVKVLPPVDELFGRDRVSASDIRDLTEADLLGRHQIQTNVDEIAGYLTGKRVLVTGAGGSIGSELCQQIHRYAPAQLVMLDRDESALHQVELLIYGKALLDNSNTALVDIRDVEATRAIFAEHRPQVVFHAAALKHLPLLERHPDEAFKSNVIGTLNVLETARDCGVEVFVNISTDKAANPTSVLGYSKRIAERITAHVATTADAGTFLSVRFGNVLGSRGSVLIAFREQILKGGPVTVTDRDVTRFFMTIPEAVQLVIQAGAIGRSGEVLVLDMGEPVRIYDVARRLIAQTRRPIRIVFTGLRHGEKLHEELFGDGEADVRPRHPLIAHAAVPPLDPRQLGDVARSDTLHWMTQHR